jgi:sarcosine oxidase, subunit beta
VLERSGIGAEASGVQPGGVRHQWSTRLSCKLAIESVAFYQEIDRHLEPEGEPKLDRCGYVFVADSEEELARLDANIRVQNELGIPSSLVSPAEVAEIVPGLLTDAIAGAAYCAIDGYFDKPQAVVEGFAAAAQRNGVLVERAEVVAMASDGSDWRLSLGDGSELTASQVVVAAGCDSPPLLQPLGVELPITKEARYLFFSEPIRERLLEPLVVASERRFAAKQLASGRVLASDLSAGGDPESGAQHWRENVSEGIRSLLPVLEFVSFPILVPGFYDVTPDHQPIVGPVPGREGLWLATGFSGHGFMIAPAVGRLVADAVGGGGKDPLLDELSLERFSAELAREHQIV